MTLGRISLDWQALRNYQGGATPNLTFTGVALPDSGTPTADTGFLLLDGWAGGNLVVHPGHWAATASSGNFRLTLAARILSAANDRAFATAVEFTHTRGATAGDIEWPALTLPTANLDGAIHNGTQPARLELRIGRDAADANDTYSGDCVIRGLWIEEA